MDWFTQYRTCQVAAIILTALSATLLFIPGLIFWLFNMAYEDGGVIFARRAAMLFAGLAFLVWKARALPRTAATDAIFQAFMVLMAGLACVGLFEFLRGGVGIGIFLAIVVEVFFVIAFARLVGAQGAASGD